MKEKQHAAVFVTKFGRLLNEFYPLFGIRPTLIAAAAQVLYLDRKSLFTCVSKHDIITTLANRTAHCLLFTISQPRSASSAK